MTVYQVDAFCEGKYLGNPAGVCVLNSPAPDHWMQEVAREMALSETAFLTGRQDNSFDLRWFTPKVEVKLCGHATLASAHLLWERGYLKPSEAARFHTLSGLLGAERAGERMTLNFPAKPAVAAAPPPGLIEALGVKPLFTGQSQFDYLVLIERASALRDLKPDFAALLKVPARGIIVTCLSDASEFDFLSRFFAPAAGVNEDPVTGSAHCTLAPFWAERLGKTKFLACQISERGGVIGVELRGDRVFLSGKAATVGQRELPL